MACIGQTTFNIHWSWSCLKKFQKSFLKVRDQKHSKEHQTDSNRVLYRGIRLPAMARVDLRPHRCPATWSRHLLYIRHQQYFKERFTEFWSNSGLCCYPKNLPLLHTLNSICLKNIKSSHSTWFLKVHLSTIHIVLSKTHMLKHWGFGFGGDFLVWFVWGFLPE